MTPKKMKYSPKIYGQAFAEIAKNIKTPQEKEDLIKKFLALLEKNGDMARIQEIIKQTEKILRQKSGIRKITIESARPIGKINKKEIGKIIKESDIVEEKLNPDLIAGIKIIINDELQFDGSLSKKIKCLMK